MPYMSGRTPPKKPSPLHAQVLAEIQRQEVTGYRITQQTGLPPTTVHRFLTGESSPTVTTLETIAKALGLAIDVRRI